MDRFVDDLKVLDLSNEERFSFSKIKSYQQCPLQYLLHYRFHKRGADNGWSLAGSIAHGVLDDYYKGKLTEFELIHEFEKRWDEKFYAENWRIKVFGRDQTDKVKQDFLNFFADVSLPAGWNVVEAEKSYTMIFHHKGEKVMLTGILDLLVTDENGDYIIVDNKSKTGFKNEAEKAEYLKQLYLYSLFFRQQYGKWPKKLAFNMMRQPIEKRIVSADFEEETLWEVVDWIFGTVREIEQEFLWSPNKDAFYCGSLCEFRKDCQHNPLNQMDEE